jgi:hypothetical protein
MACSFLDSYSLRPARVGRVAVAVAILTIGAVALPGVVPRNALAQSAAGQVASVPDVRSASEPPLPDVSLILERVRERIRLDRELQSQYTYLERRRDVKVSKLGKVTVGPLRTFEVYPSAKPGRTYKRLVAIDGQPLPRAQLEQRDEAHRQHVLAMIEQEKNETSELREKRVQQEQKDLRERRALIDDAFAVFEVTLTGRETLDGQRVIASTLTPRPDARTRTDEGKWMKKFKGRAWVSDNDYQVVKIDMEAIDDITIGWGFVGRVHEGSRFTFTRTKVNDEIWLPAEAKFEASGRTLLFRKFRIFTVTSYSDYKKFNVDTEITYDLPKIDP